MQKNKKDTIWEKRGKKIKTEGKTIVVSLRHLIPPE